MRLARQKAEDAQAKLEKLNLQLELTYKKLMEAARIAGMAEVAANVLHNVGNALNSINVSANLISEKLSKSEIINLQKLSDLLKNHSDNMADFLTNDPQGKFVPTYLIEASNHLVQQKNEIHESLRSLIKNVEHIKDIVHMQQLYTAIGQQQDCVSLSELIENAIDAASTEIAVEIETKSKLSANMKILGISLSTNIESSRFSYALSTTPNTPWRKAKTTRSC